MLTSAKGKKKKKKEEKGKELIKALRFMG